ncbi:MAG TPA: carboxypeptidase-like regulatory domain-containing protein [Acidobacteriaceae bacterium]|nr:carboxypeptidase-like regulatory domain-containing protein [Acidobacteriaceae bacterium]
MTHRKTFLALLLLCSTQYGANAQTSAQAAPKPAPTGSVSGLVVCSDTNSPARFATVIPIPIPATGQASPAPAPVVSNHNIARTDLSGRYILKQLPPGDYLVVAELDGYATPVAGVSLQQITAHDPAAMKSLTDIIPVTHVEAGKSATANFTLLRGAVISGTIRYDDGTPAIDTEISVSPSSATRNEYVPSTGLSLDRNLKTDSFGHYSIQGLAEGRYIVSARMHPSEDLMNILSDNFTDYDPYSFLASIDEVDIYPPRTFHRKAAVICDLKQGERQQVDIEISLDGLRTITGVIKADPSEPAPVFGTLSATAVDDPDLVRLTVVRPDGSFQFSFMPAAKYTLSAKRVSNLPPRSVRAKGDDRKPFAYPPAGSSVDVTNSDASSVVITIPPPPPPKVPIL